MEAIAHSFSYSNQRSTLRKKRESKREKNVGQQSDRLWVPTGPTLQSSCCVICILLLFSQVLLASLLLAEQHATGWSQEYGQATAHVRFTGKVHEPSPLSHLPLP